MNSLRSVSLRLAVVVAGLLFAVGAHASPAFWLSALIGAPDPALASFQVAPGQVIGADAAQVMATLSEPAPVGGATVSISYGSNLVSGPASLVVPAGETQGSATVSSNTVRSPQTATITGSYAGTDRVASLRIVPFVVQSVTVTPGSVVGGASATGVVTLGDSAPPGGSVVQLSSDRASVPATVTVPYNQRSASFTVLTSPVGSARFATVYARFNGAVNWGTLHIRPPRITSFSLALGSLNGGQSTTGSVAIDAPAPAGGTPVALSTNRTDAVNLPAMVTVAQGQTSASFPISTNPGVSQVGATLYAATDGIVRHAVLQVAPVRFTGFAISPDRFTGWSFVRLRFVLSDPAPAGGYPITVEQSDNPGSPWLAIVPQGQTTHWETIAMSTEELDYVLTIRASGGGRVFARGMTVFGNMPLVSSNPIPSEIRSWGKVEVSEGASSRTPGIRRFSGGDGYMLGLREDGSVFAFGARTLGAIPRVPDGLGPARDVAAGPDFAVASLVDGTLAAWGDNTYNQAAPPAGIHNARKVSAGAGHAVALRSNLTPIAWGRNDYGQAPNLSGWDEIVDVAAGGEHTLLLHITGTVFAIGRNQAGQCTVPLGLSGVKSVYAGAAHSVALQADGTVVAWGSNTFGQSTPPAAKLKAVAVYGNTNIGVTQSDALVAWGENVNGLTAVPGGFSSPKIGIGSRMAVAFTGGPQLIASWGSEPVTGWCPEGFQGGLIQADAGGFVVGVTRTGGLQAYGTNVFGRVSGVPNTMHSPVRFVKAVAGLNHGLALQAGGRIRAWGDSSLGQTNIPSAVEYAALDVAAAGNNSAAVHVNGSAYVWGANGSGQTTVPASALSGVVQVVLGRHPTLAAGGFAVALKQDGSVIAWGDNSVGQTNTPSGLQNAVKLAAKHTHVLALKADGTVEAWGSNGSGESSVPAGLSDVVDIAAGGGFSAALKADGTLVTWGANPMGVRTSPGTNPGWGGLFAGYDIFGGIQAVTVGSIQGAVNAGSGAPMFLVFPVAFPTDTAIQLESSTGLVSVPSSVTARAGRNWLRFWVTPNSELDQNASIKATVNGRSYYGAVQVVPRPPRPVSISSSRTQVAPGEWLTFTVALDRAIPDSPEFWLEMWSSHDDIPVQGLVLGTPGSQSITVPVRASRVAMLTAPTMITIFARYGGVTRHTNVLLVPPTVQSLTLDRTQVVGGDTVQGTITLTSPAVGGLEVNVSSNRTQVAVPPVVLVVEDQAQATFTITTTPVTQNLDVTIYISVGGRTRWATLRLTPPTP